jgi:dCMP deaminase
MSLSNWDKRFLELAKLVSSWSKDPSTKVGAVIVDDQNIIVSVGFNGFPKGIEDNDRLNHRDSKYQIIIHAENNALMFAKRPLDNCTLYTYPFMPCPRCAGMIIQSGIKRVVSYKNTIDRHRWELDFSISRELFNEANMQLEEWEDGRE